MLKRLINTGIHSELSFKEQGKIRIFNASVLAVSSILILYTIIGILQGLYLSTVVTAAELLCFAVNLWLIHKRRYIASYHFGMANGMIFLIAAAFLLGESNQTHLYFLFMPMAAMIIFDDKRIILAYFILSMLMLTASYLIFKYIPPYYGKEVATFGFPNLIFTGLLIFLGIKLFKSENLAFNEKINHQNQLLEEKNKDITDSIHYAKRIQSALMASDTVMKKNLPEHFVLYKPKDIVSGDFFWGEKIENKFMLATCDCTGHGVPGAFMSLLGVSFLNEITKERNITRPDLVFNSLRDHIIKALNPEGAESDGKDGMDAVLCNFDFSAPSLEFTCANNPLWILRNDQWMEFKPDKFPIGMQENARPFTLQKIELQKGDVVYTFTDGYADQFGGEKGKKFKYRNLQTLIASISKKSMEEQKNILNKTIEDWKGNLEQVDDILIIGIRV